ncbi:MAG: leucine-rich repeat protein [Paludibacteraceae bacterium]|nr:leucine-rich repeat protein [Paludibacteraceae bacterium]
MLIIDQKELLNHKELLLPNDKDVKITGTINDRHLLFLKQIYAQVLDLSNMAFDIADADSKSFKGIKRIIISEYASELPDFAFSFSPALQSVYISKNISKIGEQPFCYCNNLSAIEVDGQNNYFSSIDGVLFNKDKKRLIRCPEGQFGVYTVPDGVEEIFEYAFYGCNGLNEIKLPASLKKIGKFAFQQCEGLHTITIPDGVTTLEECTFFGCINLQNVHVSKQLSVLGKEAFYGCVKLEAVSLPNTVREIQSPFVRCFSLSSISIDEGGDTLFTNDDIIYNKKEACLALSPTVKNSHQVLDGTKAIGRSAFESTSIADIRLANSVTTICERAFRGCYFLKEIVLPENIVELEDRAFDSCTYMTKITSLATTPPKIQKYSFCFVPLDDAVLYVPAVAVDSYRADPLWNMFKNIQPIE